MSDAPELRSETDSDFDALLEYLKGERGFDFGGYKRVGLKRRFRRRMQLAGIDSFADYHDHLQVHPHEFVELFDALLINVTGFFRDPDAWATLAERVIPRILEGKSATGAIRVWSAGCSSGEEPYTLAMLFAEALEEERFRTQVKIYATDVDEDALNQARQGVYTPRQVEGVPDELRERYFERSGGSYVVRPELRRAVIFGRNDLARDAPISNLDLLVCRNTLMYFNAELQERIMARFHFALRDNGFMMLGRAEMLLRRSSLFVPVDMKQRIFAKVPRAGWRDRLLMLAPTGVRAPGHGGTSVTEDIGALALDRVPMALLLVNAEGIVAFVNERARNLFRLAPHDIGRPLQDLEISYRPIELRSRIEQAYSERRPVYLNDVEYSAGGSVRQLDVQVMPLWSDAERELGVGIFWTDVTRYRRMQSDLERANDELATAYEELQATNEELETANEELQSAVEELETTNEELQSTNEELETMNEELHSTNEELETINDELRRRTEELNRISGYMEAILGSVRTGVAVLDPALRVQVWSSRAEDLWGVRAREAEGEPFLGLDIGLPLDPLREPLRQCADGGDDTKDLVLSAMNRRGRHFRCRVSCTPLRGGDGSTAGLILQMEPLRDETVQP